MNEDTKRIASLLIDGVLEEAEARSLTVVYPGGRTTVEFDGGLTQEHYTLLAPSLTTDSEKAELALGVLSNTLRCRSCDYWLDIKGVFYREWEDFEEWVLAAIDDDGFDAVANYVEEWWMDYLRNHPPTPSRVTVVAHPTWDTKAGILSFGSKMWKLRVLNGPTKVLLDEFEKRNWTPSVCLESLHPEQVRDVAKELREKTKGFIRWSASSDCTISWRIG